MSLSRRIERVAEQLAARPEADAGGRPAYPGRSWYADLMRCAQAEAEGTPAPEAAQARLARYAEACDAGGHPRYPACYAEAFAGAVE